MNLLAQLTNQLSAVYSSGEARALARWVLEERFHLSQTDILLGKDSELSAEDHKELQNIIVRLERGEPVQYVLGYTMFCDRRFSVRQGVLIPRPETQELVRLVMNCVERDGETLPTILDIGTGSGCIAVSLALEKFSVTAWDVSEDALCVARENAEILGANVLFEKKDILHIACENRRWDAIVSNPPYVRRSEASDMDTNVLEHEPHLALFVSDEDPLCFYRAIAQFGLDHLSGGGRLFFEINQYLGVETVDLLRSMNYREVCLLKDEFGNCRMVKCVRP